MAGTRPMNNKTTPLVSIICITYNHEKYISQALDGFVMQKTDFPFEILIHDDASTDRTAEIIRKYEKSNINKNIVFKPIYEKQNQYSSGNYDFTNDMFKSAKGKYIAYCEGDDYWTDPEKLQRQVDFMEKHPDYAICFHPVRVFFESKESKEYIYPDTKDKSKFTVKELLEHNFIQTNSVMYKKQKYINMPSDVMPGDIYWHLYHAQFGKIGFIDRIMSEYRRHAGGVWQDSYKGNDEIWKKYAIPHLALFVALRELYGDQAEYKTIIDTAIDNMFNKLIDLDKKYGSKSLEQVTHRFYQVAAEFITRQHREILEERLDKSKKLQEKDQDILKLQQTVNDIDHQIKLRDQQLSDIQASRVWKARNKVAKLRGREEI